MNVYYYTVLLIGGAVSISIVTDSLGVSFHTTLVLCAGWGVLTALYRNR